MKDQEFIDALQAVFDANDPFDGIDRHDGYGRDYRIESIRVVPSPDGFDDLEVTVRIGAETVTSRLLFDHAWREASGLDDVLAYATYVVRRWNFPRFDHAVLDQPSGPGRDDSWKLLEQALGRRAEHLNQPAPGVLEVVESNGDVVTIHVTPQEWASFAAGREQKALDVLDELIGSRWDDEDHIVYFRGALHHSVRAQLPPVRRKLLL